jgi:hypothetical protein
VTTRPKTFKDFSDIAQSLKGKSEYHLLLYRCLVEQITTMGKKQFALNLNWKQMALDETNSKKYPFNDF